ncbi:hypothetical protein pEaSNUABM28_00244 [Erwinia phage pEa_SNUABM_28]|uniref:Uncharacterized protein n=2 Tax=Alexandravirus TaxID=2733088 RepID=A0AAE9BUN6_9CAUD|nr:hypothetical protein MPK63_gp241 [Erwinia phage pEa_SNUABM_22]YP_010300003.1 hypothetical protein MPK64_gp242 [Erwinia phage pEa_SNUABM_16]QZE58801.1 hypothetical protein pEaSNUABM28_00244 [Erwinia phage pEa_SNUABM_28]QZE59145.1 hypothetical protein pEaSNUABM18_00242 [Erwinia phage pEa_SNUABM_18]UAW96386.1 hypothetical protein pEaSNUABM16_00242 [Erwinia phage pEa_SNUABM_16]UAW96729.1 hypothetical protein pEaSNUABM22_00242 [Erwinia phage pEa_SNUABM_22]
MTDQVITFEDQQSWEDFGEAVHNEFLLNTMTGSSSASQIPSVGPNEGVKHALTYANILRGEQSPIVVLDLLIEEVALAEGETSPFDADGLEQAVRKVVALYQARARDLDCHITGQYLTDDNKVIGALLRVYRNQDFPCTGHPEMLHGKPIGMFHCDKCHEMQVAGTFHLPKEETQNG